MKTNHTDKDAILTQWLNGDISADEASKHLSREEFLKYTQILTEVDQWVPDQDTEIFDPRLVLDSPKKSKSKVISLLSWKYISVAAAIILAIFVGQSVWKSSLIIEHQTAYGEIKTVDLPDGSSKMILSANSIASWSKSDWKKGKRKITLTGKAYFDVPQEGEFDVVTSEGTVSVLGTRFVVHQVDQALHATCYQGRVRATAKSNKSIVLDKGESSLFFNGKWDPKKLFDAALPDWIKDHISFDNTPIKIVLSELESNYGLSINYGSINLARRFTGSIPKEDLDQALKIIFPTLGISYRLDGKTLYLSE
ncbi:MAG: FecR domain-containing protein [Reichenbachiella sp.]|uniref:FecR family protein n=1 Tax=Reichenbachiella sp. TaxID=2184521 RepID=UPI003267F3AA